MIKKEMIAMLLAGGQGSRLGVLTQKLCIRDSIISDEIADSRRERMESLEKALAETTASLQELENSIKEQNIHIADTFGPYLGKEYMDPDRLAELSRMIQSGRAGNITEAIRVYEEGEK